MFVYGPIGPLKIYHLEEVKLKRFLRRKNFVLGRDIKESIVVIIIIIIVVVVF